MSFFKCDDVAVRYDGMIKQQAWYGPEILFGMLYEEVSAGDTLLDMGIGTGLSAAFFSRLGLIVHGLDYSSEMLAVCREKGVAEELKQWDLSELPLPYPDRSFNHVSANAVLYFLRELEGLFAEVARIVKKGGMWAFVVEVEGDPGAGAMVEKPPGKNGLVMYRHSRDYILTSLATHGFSLVKETIFIAENFQLAGRAVPFTVFVAQAAGE